MFYLRLEMNRLVKFPSKKEIETAAAILKNGGVVVYPTDTVVGVGCFYDDQKAIERIYQIKKRPKVPMPILIASLSQLKLLGCQLTTSAKNLVKKFWPGALTVILPCNSVKIAVRMPNYPPVLDLIRSAGKPIIGTSANFHDRPAVGRIKDLDENFKKLVDYIVSGECSLKKESTVVDCTGRNLKILRLGALRIRSG